MPRFIRALTRTQNLIQYNPWPRTINWRSWEQKAKPAHGPRSAGKGVPGTFRPSKYPRRKHRSSSAPIRTRSSFLVTVARPARVSDSPITRAIGLHSSRPLAHGPVSVGLDKTHGCQPHTSTTHRSNHNERRTYLRGHHPHHPKNRLLHLRAHRRRNRCNPSRLLSSRTRTTNLAHRSISRVLFHWCSFRNHRRSEHPKTAYRNRTRHY